MSSTQQPTAMKTIIQSLVVLSTIVAFTSCTAYVDPDVTSPAATRTTTTRTTAESPYLPGASVTTQETTTRY